MQPSIHSSDLFMPHGHCYLWQPDLLWLQVLSNATIGVAYVIIAITLAVLVYRIKDIPFRFMYLAFGIFIITCGFTHFFDVWVIWEPDYWADGTMRAVTAVASLGTALALPPLVPKAVALARGAQAAHEKGIELETMVEELARSYANATELAELKTEFFANVSHELRTPLALILGPLENSLRWENLSAEQREQLRVARRNAKTLVKHVDDLLDVARVEAGRSPLEYEASDLAESVQATAAHFEGVAKEQDIDFQMRVPNALPIEMDSNKIERVNMNLLSNAFKFSPRGGVVRCQLTTVDKEGNGARAQLVVSDSGPGIAPDHRERIFERFAQVDGATPRASGGSGLGLAICREFVELHAGTIRVDESELGGAEFTVELPLSAPEGMTVRPARSSARVEDAAASSTVEELKTFVASQVSDVPSERAQVLVVEDNVEMNRFVTGVLRPHFRVAVALNGEEGLAKALESPPDLVLTDLMMPQMDGEQLIAKLRERPELRAIPIMLLTAKGDDELKVKLLESGVQDYLMKPFSPAELRARVTNLVAATRARDVLQRALDTQVDDLERLAANLGQKKRELATALDAVRVARDQALKASELKTSFLRMVSHELRTPLAILQLQIDRLQTDPLSLSRVQQQGLQRMASATQRLTDLIESILQHARIESGRIQVDIQTFSLKGLAEEVVEDLHTVAERKGIALELEPEEELPELSSDPKLVRLIMVNLVNNALKFTNEGRVAVCLSASQGTLEVSVSDTGVGIPKSEQAGIFEPFQQLEPTHQKHTPGVGLGLALTREMVNALGGSISLDSEPGRGSRFTVTFPQLQPPAST